MSSRALLQPTRRRFALLATALLATPLLLLPFAQGQRRAALDPPAAPSLPAAGGPLRSWADLPRAFDARFADWLARGPLMALADGARAVAGSPEVVGSGAVAGRGGFLFLRDGLLQSSGRSLHSLEAQASAKVVCAVATQVRRRGGQFLYAIVPSAGEVYPEALPTWAGPRADVTDYDLLVRGAQKCGVAALDLRPGLRAAKEAGPVFRRTDEHWTPLGVLTAYNRIADSLDHPRWRLAPETLRWRREVARDGPLPRLAGLQPTDEPVSVHEAVALPASSTKASLTDVAARSAEPFVIETGHPGPTVLILGDSFTSESLPPLLAPRAGRIAWMHYENCAFDWRALERLRPDIVLAMPAERQALCRGHRPKGFRWAIRLW